jgi:putative mRNA 3-end processing factor
LNKLLVLNENGLYCQKGDFYIDPWKPVKTAFITHGHSDHARNGHGHYYCVSTSIPILKHRLGSEINILGMNYAEKVILNDITISFHPAGHVLGSAQVRIDDGSDIWVVSGDFKRQFDPTCEPFEVVKCNTFITEATFALPIYRWPSTKDVIQEIYSWYQTNKSEGRASVLFCYALGKAQRLLAELQNFMDDPVFIHGALESLIQIYRESGIKILPTINATDQEKSFDFSDKLIIAPPSAHRSTWMRRFGNASTGFVSGWMTVRAQKTQGGYDKGFVLSDHADWYDLIKTINETGAKTIYVTHGKSDNLVRYIQEEMGLEAYSLKTEFQDQED